MKMIDYLESFAIILCILSFICSILSVIMVVGISKHAAVCYRTENQLIALKQVKDIPIGPKEIAYDKEQARKEELRKKREQEEKIFSERAKSLKTMGVLLDDTYRYTWYSSKVLYHYRTPEWTPDSNGVYKDKDGYIVVASSVHKQGTVLHTLLGSAKVYDTGCPAGTIDVYVNW